MNDQIYRYLILYLLYDKGYNFDTTYNRIMIVSLSDSDGDG